jgi:hypothetical protein
METDKNKQNKVSSQSEDQTMEASNQVEDGDASGFGWTQTNTKNIDKTIRKEC